MSDINALKTSILEQAHQEGKLRLNEAKDQVDKDFQGRKTKLLHEKEAERNSRLKEISQKFQVEAQQIRNQERQSTLASKQKILKELFVAAQDKMTAWSAAEELSFTKEILAKYADQNISVSFGQLTADKLTPEDINQLQADFPQVIFNETTVAKEAGLIVSDNHVDDTYLYSNLIESIYKEESARIAAAIFREN